MPYTMNMDENGINVAIPFSATPSALKTPVLRGYIREAFNKSYGMQVL